MEEATPSPHADSSNRAQDVSDYINDISYTGSYIDYTRESTTEEKALYYLIVYDPLQLSADDSNDQFRLRQRYALLTLWFMGTVQWTFEDGWLDDEDECAWYGIFCDGDVVTEIDLDGSGAGESGAGNNVHGRLSPDIALLTELTEFDVSDNAISGPLPDTIGEFTEMEWFSVSYNRLTGTIPDAIENWEAIEVASFYNNEWTGWFPNGMCVHVDPEVDDIWADCFMECSCCNYCEP